MVLPLGGPSGRKVRKMSGIALIQTPSWGVSSPPVALAQLSACLKKAGHDAKVFDMNVFLYGNRVERYRNSWAIEQSSFWCDPRNVERFFTDNTEAINKYVRRIAAAKPRVACFSVNVCSWHSVLRTAGILKKELPGVTVVIGGPSFLVPFEPRQYLENDEIDIIVRGESELTLPELAGRIGGKEDIASCKGLCFKRNGGIVDTGERGEAADLDALPFMDFSDTPFDDYDPPGHLGRHIPIMTSRGCVQKCVFCGPRGYWPGFRSMSGSRICKEIEHHAAGDPGIRRIEFLDLLLNGNMAVLTEFCDLMAGGTLRGGLQWHANLIIRKEMTLEVFRKMKSAGCTHVTFGIESGSQRVLDRMKKRYGVGDADAVLKNAHEAGLKVTCNFMFGFPGETREDFSQTLRFLERNKKYITMAYPSRTFCTIEPHSYMQEHMDEFDIIPNPEHGQYWVSRDGTNTYLARMERCDEFSRFAGSIGVDIGLGLETSYELDRWLSLGNYYCCIGDVGQAKECLRKYLVLDPSNISVQKRYESLKSGLRGS
ncbi:MAG: B12-binding domain-containing radical SAM protein [Endomicrobiales bacterium]|nr:B12-binding domain-containing radical SAM protein [Endomicrobiales bacterium]